MEIAGKKYNDRQIKKSETLLTSSLHVVLLFKNLFIPLFPASHDMLKTRDFRKNAVLLRVYLP